MINLRSLKSLLGEEEEETIPNTYTMDENINEGDFPVRETNGDSGMKNISPFSLTHFHGLTSEDPDTFLFGFVAICKTYDYTFDDQKLKLFPSNLKDATLRWFMGLLGDNITTWAQMQQSFNNKYMDYCRSKDTKEEIFRMTLGLDESLEYYKERFQLSYKRAICTLDPESLMLVLLRGTREDILETLKGRVSQALASSSSSTTSIKSEIGNMLEDFKSEMLHTFSLKMDTM